MSKIFNTLKEFIKFFFPSGECRNCTYYISGLSRCWKINDVEKAYRLGSNWKIAEPNDCCDDFKRR